MKTKSLAILLFVLTAGVNHAQKVTFSRENAVFNLDSMHFTVNCDLYFKNNTSTAFSQTFFFPFSCESHIVKVDSVAIFDVNQNVYLKPARRNIAGVLFTINFTSQELKKIKVTYSQDHDGRLAGFVMTKIKYWNEPLAQANYTLNVNSPSIKMDSTSFKPSKISDEPGKTVYTWNKANFMPEKELCIYFHLK
jgi:hypothetical protein